MKKAKDMTKKEILIANMNSQMDNINQIMKQLNTEIKRIDENISADDIEDIEDYLDTVEANGLAVTGYILDLFGE